MKFSRTIALVLMVAFLTLMATGCGGGSSGGEAAKKDIKIGLAAPMTGNDALWGQTSLKAAQLAVDEANEKGGIDGRKIVLVPGDDKGDPKEAASVAQKFVSDPDIIAVVGHAFSGAELSAGPIYNNAGIPNMVFTASNPKIPAIGEYVFRISVDDVVAAQQTATYCVQKLGLKKTAVIYDNMDYGVAFKSNYIDQAKKLGAQIVAEETFVGSGQDRDLTVQLTKIAAAKPDSILVVAYAADGALVWQQAKQLGIEATFIGPDSLNTDQFLNLSKEAAEGAIITTYFDRGVPDPKAKAFVEKYEATYKEPAFTTCPYAYDATLTVIDALKRAGKVDRKALRDAIEQTKDLVGVTGKIFFDKEGGRPVAWNVVLEVKNGKFVIKDLIQ